MTRPPTRPAGLRGLLPQRQGADRFPIRWLHEYDGTLAAETVSYPIDLSGGRMAWGMFLNDQLPDCVVAGFENLRLSSGAQPAADSAVSALFTKLGGTATNGLVMADALLALYHMGLVSAFAPVAPNTLDVVMSRYRRPILMGSLLTDQAEAEFEAWPRRKWMVSPTEQPDPQDGHCTLIIKRFADHSGTTVTWAGDEDFTADWFAACEQELWIALTPDDKAKMGAAAWAQLVAGIDSLPYATPPASQPGFFRRICNLFR